MPWERVQGKKLRGNGNGLRHSFFSQDTSRERMIEIDPVLSVFREVLGSGSGERAATQNTQSLAKSKKQQQAHKQTRTQHARTHKKKIRLLTVSLESHARRCLVRDEENARCQSTNSSKRIIYLFPGR
jgi:hypothetical protein